VTFNLASAYYQRDELQKSLKNYDEALSLAQAMGDRQQQAYILNSIGFALKDMGELPKAFDHLKRALALLDGPGTRRFEAKAHNNIGIAYKEMGDYTKALDAYQRSLSISRELEDKIAEPQLLNNIGNIYKAENENRKSIEYYDQALALFKEQNNRTGEALALNNIGSAYFQMGEYQKALDYNQRSLEIRRSRGEIRWESSSLYHAGRALWKLGQKEKAIESFSQSLEIRRRFSDPIGEADALLGLAGVRRDMGELDEARTHIESALKLTEGIRSRLAGGDLRASYIARVQETYEFYIGLLMEMHRRTPSAGYNVEALVAAERTRARVLVESLAEARVDLRQGVDAETLKQERTTQKQLSDASAELSRLLASSSAEGSVAAARAKLEKLSVTYQQIQSQIRQNSPRYAALTQPESLKLGEIQALLDENSVLLEYALGEERSFLWAVTRTSVNSYELPGRDRIGAATGSVYGQWIARQPKAGESPVARGQRVAAADANALREGEALSRMLLGPVAAQLKNEWAGKRLLVVAAGAIEYLPFAALPAPDTTSPLIADHEIINLPSVSSLAVLRSGTAERQPATKVVAVLADPVFEKNDPRLSLASARKPAQEVLALQVRSAAAVDAPPSWASVRGEVGGDSFNARRGLSRLPFSREEADAIAALAPANSRLKATDFSASLASVMGGELENYRIVHFATHGLVDSERPELSGLVLSLIDENGTPQNGFLRMAEIYNLRLKADLVVLSACQTGLGKQIKGEGLIGLTRGFMYAGAPRVVASLWQVDDMATAELMKRFYRGVLKDGVRPAAALRTAQLEMMKQKRWAAPYYWAAFVLQGEWK
jgi:CHAT domain-containing protein/Tfp pilus assembly protein PilF